MAQLNVASVQLATAGGPLVSNDFGAWAASYVQKRAEQALLSLVQNELASELGSVSFSLPAVGGTKLTFTFDKTSALLKTADLATLLSQGTQLRGALSYDATAPIATALSQSGDALENDDARTISQLVAVVQRFAASPSGHLEPTDIGLAAEPLLNTSWCPTDATAVPSAEGGIWLGIRAADSYLAGKTPVAQVQQNPALNDCLKIDSGAGSAPGANATLADWLGYLTKGYCPNGCKDIVYYDQSAQWAELAVESITAKSADGKTLDYRQELRSLAELAFEAYDVASNNSSSGAPCSAQEAASFACWARDAVIGVLDTNASEIVVAIADGEKKAIDPSHKKLTALLTGISAYAITLDQQPTGTTPAASDSALETARENALESAIDAATDRSNRGGDYVLSFGATAGFGIKTSLKLLPQNGTSAESAKFGAALSLPVEIAFQHLPKWQFKGCGYLFCSGWVPPFHLAFAPLDLGNYIAPSVPNASSPGWQSLLGAAGQVGLPIGTPKNFFIVGYQLGYLPRYATTSLNSSTVGRSARSDGWFVAYYVPFWDFN